MTYADVGGCYEAIEKLREVVEAPLLRVSYCAYFSCGLQPERFARLGIDPPKGVLLCGPPGTGKTLCARAVANRTDACFIRCIASELVQKYVGEVSRYSQVATNPLQGARLVREIFELARTKKACVIFFDEVDAIGGARSNSGANADSDVNRTMLELIVQLDGFDARGNIRVLMATNRPDTLDPVGGAPCCSLLAGAGPPRSPRPPRRVLAARPGGSHAHLRDLRAPDVDTAQHPLRPAGASVPEQHGRRDPFRVHRGGHVRHPRAPQDGQRERLPRRRQQSHPRLRQVQRHTHLRHSQLTIIARTPLHPVINSPIAVSRANRLCANECCVSTNFSWLIKCEATRAKIDAASNCNLARENEPQLIHFRTKCVKLGVKVFMYHRQKCNYTTRYCLVATLSRNSEKSSTRSTLYPTSIFFCITYCSVFCIPSSKFFCIRLTV